jgi:hypothetical protein
MAIPDLDLCRAAKINVGASLRLCRLEEGNADGAAAWRRSPRQSRTDPTAPQFRRLDPDGDLPAQRGMSRQAPRNPG